MPKSSAPKSKNLEPRPDQHQGTSTSPLDLAIIGGGPAALSAAIYAARAGLGVTVYERNTPGGALVEISKISNYPGFTGPGPKLAEALEKQAKASGANLIYGECTKITPPGNSELAASSSATNDFVSTKNSSTVSIVENLFTLTIDEEEYFARSVLIATGSEPRQLDFFVTPPVSYCALCDGPLVEHKNVVVVGGGNSALQEGLYLADIADRVTIVSHSAFKARQDLLAQAEKTPNITLKEGFEADAEYLNSFEHVFVYIGKRPATSVIEGLSPTLDPTGHIITGQNSHQSKIPGLFTAGDVRAGAICQAITASADGVAASLEIYQYLKS